MRVARRVAGRLLAGFLAATTALVTFPAAAQTSASAELWATQGADCVARADEAEPWWNTNYSAECRARFVLGQFQTLDEKLLFLGGLPEGDTGALPVRDVAAALRLPTITGADGPAGLTRGPTATAMPSPISVAASFDVEMATLYGQTIAGEFRAAGTGTILGPAFDIARNWRSGRLSESMGEDPLLTARMAAAEVSAISQGGVLVMIKHYGVYTQEAGRVGDAPSGSGQVVNNVVSERAMREIYLPGFEAAVRLGGAGGVMCGFPRINGVFACENPFLFDVLKAEWGFDGYVSPDFPSAQRSITRAVLAGLDTGSSGPNARNASLEAEKPLRQAVLEGDVPMARIDDMVLRRLIPNFRLGLYDNPPVRAGDDVSTPEHRAAAARILAAGTVLLRNERGILPFGPDVTSVALIGHQATASAVVVEQGSPYVRPAHLVSALDGLRARVGEGINVTHAPGTLGLAALPPADPAQFATPEGEPGFVAQYYSSANLFFPGGPRADAVVVDPSLDAAPTIPGLPRNNQWSVRYDSVFTPAASGLHRFSLHGSGSARLWVGGELMGEFAAADFGNAIYANVELPSGVPVNVRIEYTPRAALRSQRLAMFGMEMGLTLRFGHAGPDTLLRDAARAAREADVAVVVVGEQVGEGMDRSTLALQADQDRLIAAVAAANPNTVVVLNTGGPVAMPWRDDVAGVLEMWLPGDAFGTALAGLLVGDLEPGGRLPITFPADELQGPGIQSHQMPGLHDPVTGALGDAYFDEGIFVGYRYFDKHGEQPLYAFGYGLSYADIAMDNVAVTLADDGGLQVRVELTNASDRAGTAVPQLYIGLPEETRSPPWQLKGFASVELAAGESTTVTLTVSADDLRYWDAALGQWRLAPGTYRVALGQSSRDFVWQGEVALRP